MAKFIKEEDSDEQLDSTVAAIKKLFTAKGDSLSVEDILKSLNWTDNGANRFIIGMALTVLGK